MVDSKKGKKTRKTTERKDLKKSEKNTHRKKEEKECCKHKKNKSSFTKDLFNNKYFIAGIVLIVIALIIFAVFYSGKDKNTNPESIKLPAVVDNNIGDSLVIVSSFQDPTLISLVGSGKLNELKKKYKDIKFTLFVFGFDQQSNSFTAMLTNLCVNKLYKDNSFSEVLLKKIYDSNSVNYTEDLIKSALEERGYDFNEVSSCLNDGNTMNEAIAIYNIIKRQGVLLPLVYFNKDIFSLELLEDALKNYSEGKDLKDSLEVTAIVNKDLNFVSVREPPILDFFFNVNLKVLDYRDENAKKILEDINAEVLPVYIFDDSFKDSLLYKKFGEAFDSKAGYIGLFDSFSLLRSGVQANYYLKADIAEAVSFGRDSYAIGAEDANLTIVEFSDYQCPYCRKFNKEIFPKLKKDYIDTGKVRFYHLQLPLEQLHPNTSIASLAAICAAKQNKFFEMNKKLYGFNGESYDKNVVMEYAKDLSLDENAFSTCLESEEANNELQDMMLEASKMGLSGTPSFYIGHIILGGMLPYEEMKSLIDMELNKN